MRNFLVALQLLTVIPLKLKKAVSKDELTKSMTYFPLVGLFLGAILVLVNLIVSSLFPPLAVKAIVLVTLIIATGALPLDGFANTCEGFLSRKSPNGILTAMQESRLGSIGIVGLVSLLLIKFTLLYGLIEGVEFRTLLLMPVISRWAVVVMEIITPYVKGISEDNHELSSASGKDVYRSLLRASVITFIISLLLFRFFVIPLMIIVYLSILALRWFSLRKIGGVTSDVLGATIELMEIVTLLLISLIK